MDLWKEYYDSARDNLEKGRYTAAVEHFAKSIFLLIDLYLKRKYNITVNSHADRKAHLLSKMNIDRNCKELLEIYENVYKIYRDMYIRQASKDEALLLKTLFDDVKRIVERA